MKFNDYFMSHKMASEIVFQGYDLCNIYLCTPEEEEKEVS